MKKILSRSVENIFLKYVFLFLTIFFLSSPSLSEEINSKNDDDIIAREELSDGSTVELTTPQLQIIAKRKSIKNGWTIKISGRTKRSSFDKIYRFANVADYPEDILIVNLDPKNNSPEIMFSAFTGGAHCCSLPVFLSETSAGTWKFITYPMIDGEPPRLEDLDQDGSSEIITIDQSFLYTFDCYACSYAPYRVQQLRAGKIIDITKTALGLKKLKFQLEEMEAEAERNPTLWRSNGFLGAWVALKSILGQGQDAWKKMLLLYDRSDNKYNFGTYECSDRKIKVFDCPSEKLIVIPFPIALEDHLKKEGYWDKSIDNP